MEYFAIYSPSAEGVDADDMVFDNKVAALQTFKLFKDARMKAFKSRSEALKFAKNENTNLISFLNAQIEVEAWTVKSPPPNQPPIRSLEKSSFPAPKSQDLVKFRKEIEQNQVQKVYELICSNPRYLVSSGDTPSILKEGPRYNALHVAAMNKHAKMAKLILQTVEQTSFIELLHGFKDDPNIEEMSTFLLESYLNTPDKSRNDTPLHFAAKVGAVEVIEVLISYPLCKMKPNFEGHYPKDVICSRAPDASPELKKAIESLLNERFFVPVLRSNDSSIQPSIGEPFTPANMPKFSNDPLSPSMEIKAYAGPMTSDQAQTFRRRWKTPPRLTPSAVPSNINISFSPKSSAMSSPAGYSPRMSKSLTEIVSSTPKLKKQLFQEFNDGDDDSLLDNINSDKNGNHKVAANGILGPHEEEEFKELIEDFQEAKMEEEKAEKKAIFHGYRNPQPFMDTPVRARNDSNSNHLNHNYNVLMNSDDSMFCNARSRSTMTYLDESGSIYNSDNVCDSPSFKEKHIRLTDMNKGLETIGRDLASEANVGWKEYWDFLGRFLNIRSDDGLSCFEKYLNRLKLKEKIKEMDESSEIMQSLSPTKKNQNDSFGLNSICAGLKDMALSEDSVEKSNRITRNGLASPSSLMSRLTLLNDFTAATKSSQNAQPVKNPYTCIEQSCRTFSKRLANLLESDNIQDQHSYEKMLLQEISKLNTTIDSYKRDSRFNAVNFQKIHARYTFLLVWYLKKNNVNVKYVRNFTPLISKVYALASQFATPNSSDTKSHAVCLSGFISSYIERQEKIFNPENVDTETACVDAWNGPDIVECQCSFEVNMTSSKHRREIRKKLYNEKSFQKIDLWAHRMNQASDDDDQFLSCSDDESVSEEFFTPPQSPVAQSDSDDDMNAFEESLENFEDEKISSLYIEGEEPTKIDRDVFNALGEKFIIDETKYPLVAKWFNSMKLLNAKSYQNSLKNNFRIFTPKLKMKGGIFHT